MSIRQQTEGEPPSEPGERPWRRFARKALTRLQLHAFQAWGESRGRGFRVAKAEWEEQYRSGNWTKLDSDAEQGHYELLAEAYARYAPCGSALDVGCGPAITYKHLRAKGCQDYLGIDLSETAVRQARDRFPGADFAAADAESFTPPRTFDAVVFNEVICYFRDPVATLRRFEPALRPGGPFIISLCNFRSNPLILQNVEQAYRVIDRAECRNDHGQLWTVLVCRPRTSVE